MKNPELEWRDNAPVSSRFGDVYFNPIDGAGESRHVFLDGNRVGERLAGASEIFTIGEIGFGTGLNFLVTRAEYERLRPAARLIYFSCEAYPLPRDQLERALAVFGELSEAAEELLAAYPPAVPGLHHRILAGGRIELNLLWGDASALADLTTVCDAWYLDGFAPARNPELWSPELFARIARLSVPGTTASTFSVAGMVRRNLSAAGFSLERAPGFGRKREMLTALFDPVGPPEKAIATPAPTAFSRNDPVTRPATSLRNGADNRPAVLVVGAGLAGTALVESLTRRGRRVVLIEREGDVARGASGNGAGLAFPWLTARPTDLSRLSLAADSYLDDQLRTLQASGADVGLRRCGVLQLFHNDVVVRRFESALDAHELPADYARIVNEQEASRIAGTRLTRGGVYFPGGKMLSPRALCAAWLQAARDRELCEVIYERAVCDFRREGDVWVVRDENGNSIAAGPELVLCAAADIAGFGLTDWLPLKRVRGQVMRMPANSRSRRLKAAVCYDGYVTPGVSGEGQAEHWVGATFEEWNQEPAMIESQNLWLFEKTIQWLPDWAAAFASEEEKIPGLPGRVAFRSAARDRFPIIGPIPDPDRFARASAVGRELAIADFLPGLNVSTGHGSRGLLTAPIGAELIAARMSGGMEPVPRGLADALKSTRFLRRNLRRLKTGQK